MNRIKRRVFRYIENSINKKPDRLEGEDIRIGNAGKGKNLRFDIIGNNIEIKIGEGSLLNGTLIYVRGSNQKIEIGKSCYVGPGELWIEDDGGSIIIHDFTTIQSGHFAVTESCTIELGNDCMLSDDIEIRTGDSHSIIDKETGSRLNPASSVFIESHVWVGAHARILKGSLIHSNSIIANSSVVSMEVPSHSIAAGVPAKIIKSGIDWKRERT